MKKPLPKLAYAAALALAAAGCASAAKPDAPTTGAWLLVVPPMTQNGFAAVTDPLSKWHRVGNYDSKIDCSDSLANQQFAVHGWYGPIWSAQTPDEAQAVEVLQGHCIASDDPRLQSNQPANLPTGE